MKKYFILAAVAIVAFASCTKHELETKPTEISYNAVTAKNNLTKAIIDHSFYAPSDPNFGIWGLYQPTNWTTDHGNGVWVGTDLSAAAEIAYKDVAYDHNNDANETDREWRNNNGIDYWPLTGSVVFMGYSPYTASASIAVSSNNAVMTFSNFQAISGSPTNETDLMWSDAVESTTNSDEYVATGRDAAYNGVPVVFHHALSQITVNAKTAIDYAAQGYTFTILNITMNIDDNATLTVTDPVLANTTPTTSWTDPTTDSAPVILSSGNTALTTSFVKQGRSILVIPQDLATKRGTNDDKLTIEYKVVHNGVTSTVTKDILLTNGDNAAIDEFVENTKYNLNLVFSLEEILYSPSVVDWESPEITSEYEVPQDAE